MLFRSDSLENVLIAVSLHCPDVGYCQGMNYLGGFLLFISDLDEEQVFWAIVSMLLDNLDHDPLGVNGLSSFYSNDFKRVKLLQLWFEEMFGRTLPNLKSQLSEVPGLLWVHKWFLVLFLSSFPLSYAIRFWDFIFSYGISGIIKLGLAIMKTNKADFRKQDFTHAYELLKSFQYGKNLATIEDIIETAEKIKIDPEMVKIELPPESIEKRSINSNKHEQKKLSINPEVNNEKAKPNNNVKKIPINDDDIPDVEDEPGAIGVVNVRQYNIHPS